MTRTPPQPSQKATPREYSDRILIKSARFKIHTQLIRIEKLDFPKIKSDRLLGICFLGELVKSIVHGGERGVARTKPPLFQIVLFSAGSGDGTRILRPFKIAPTHV